MMKVATPSERLQQALREKGMRQAELSRLTGIPRGNISNYCSGRYEPKVEIIQKFAKALGCSEMWLWGYDEEKTTAKEGNTMAREALTDEQVELEIERLQESPYVKLANKERRLRNRRRMYLYGLRQLEKKGKALESAGITSEVLDSMFKEAVMIDDDG